MTNSTTQTTLRPVRPSAPATADICIVGGAGHVGLPLGIVLASRGQRVLIFDLNKSALETISKGVMPFTEVGAEPLLKQVLAEGKLLFTSDPADLKGVPQVIVTIGTPVDEFLNPDTKVIKQWADSVIPHFTPNQLIILRSTVSPGTTDWLDRYFKQRGVNVKLAYCPERIVQGFAVDELTKLPQIVSGTSDAAIKEASELFSKIATAIVHLTPLEAELAKLFCNAYRYVQFATANQFFMIATEAGADFNRITRGIKEHYPRMRDFPSAGFAAGPCLFKDTMQLAAFAQNEFGLGHAAMHVNEGLVLWLATQMEKKFQLHGKTVGLLGMAFKAECDDNRCSLSYKLKKVLQFRATDVLTTDPHVNTDPELLPLQDVIDRSDVLVLCVPHKAYKGLDVKGKPVIDIWGSMGTGLGL
jgi:UDP-N-acetyl-D-mannosaminuronic acid dehydrogenase